MEPYITSTRRKLHLKTLNKEEHLTGTLTPKDGQELKLIRKFCTS